MRPHNRHSRNLAPFSPRIRTEVPPDTTTNAMSCQPTLRIMYLAPCPLAIRGPCCVVAYQSVCFWSCVCCMSCCCISECTLFLRRHLAACFCCVSGFGCKRSEALPQLSWFVPMNKRITWKKCITWQLTNKNREILSTRGLLRSPRWIRRMKLETIPNRGWISGISKYLQIQIVSAPLFVH